MPKLKQSFLTIVIGLALAAGLSYAWIGPTAPPPGNNAPAPINVSNLSQVKTGPLQVNGFRNIGNSIFDGSAEFKSLVAFKSGTAKETTNNTWFPASDGKNYIRGTTIIADGAIGFGANNLNDRINNRVGIGTSEPKAKLDITTNDPTETEWALRIKDINTIPSGYVLTSFTEGGVDGLASWAPAPTTEEFKLELVVKENAGTASCGAKGVTNIANLGRNHFCYIQAVDSNYQGSGDTWRSVYPTTDNPDASGKRNWNAGITCYGDAGSITAICVNF